MLNNSDYIMRQINQLSQVLGRIIAVVVGLKGSGSSQEAIETINQAFTEYLELDIDALLNMDAEEMIQKLEEKKAVNNENLESIADLFYKLAQTMTDEDENEGKAKLLFQRSLHIYKYIESSGNIYSIDRNHKIEEIENMIL